MATMLRKAPTLAWVLTATSCFLVGALVGEGWGRAAPLLLVPPGGLVVTVAVVFESTATPVPTVAPPPVATPDRGTPYDGAAALTCDPFGIEAPPCDRAGDACSGGER